MSGPSETQSGAASGERDEGQPATPAPDARPTPASETPPPAVPRAGAPRPGPGADPNAGTGAGLGPGTDAGPGWRAGSGGSTSAPAAADPTAQPTTVLPGAAGPAAPRPVPARPPASRPAPRGDGRPPLPTVGRAGTTRTRRAKLALRRIDPWSVFLFSLVASIFLGIALVVAVAVLYGILGQLGVTDSMNQLFAEVTGGDAATEPLLTGGRIVGGSAVLAALNVVFLTLLATLSALLYNLCASFTGGVELTLGERD